MRIVIDTNVLISGVFFGGFPRKVFGSVVAGKMTACATVEIINEYEAIVQEMIDRKQGHIRYQDARTNTCSFIGIINRGVCIF